MTKSEFITYVNSFKGKYSNEDLYNVCLKSRSLDDQRCTWNELANLLKVGKSGDALCSWFRRQNLVADLVESISEDESNEDLINNSDEQRYIEDYKTITRNRDILNAYRKNIREDARIDAMKDEIKSTVAQLNDLPDFTDDIPDIKNFVNDYPNEAVMLVSDLHIGVDCDNCWNKYNSTIAEQRLNKFVDDTIAYCKTMNVVRLNVLNLGDMIHGLIHTTARIEQEFDVVKQVMVASELLAKALNKLQAAAPEVIYRSVTDNHSRTVANYKENIENENFYRLIDWYLEERLKGTNVIFDKESNLDPSFVFFNLLNGQTACAAHGHLDNINTSVQNFSGLTRTFVDNIFLAHYHDEKVKNFQGSTVFVNGSIVGPEQYAISKRLVGYPTQKLIIYCESSRLDISIKLN